MLKKMEIHFYKVECLRHIKQCMIKNKQRSPAVGRTTPRGPAYERASRTTKKKRSKINRGFENAHEYPCKEKFCGDFMDVSHSITFLTY